MTPDNTSKLRAMLDRHEGRFTQVYDDATGKLLRPGDTLIGWPTIAIGRNLCNPGLRSQEIELMLTLDIGERITQLNAALPWFATLDEVRQAALLDMSFMGVAKLFKFHAMLDACFRNDWRAAAREALDSLWAKQVGDRAKEIAAMLVTGVWQN